MRPNEPRTIEAALHDIVVIPAVRLPGDLDIADADERQRVQLASLAAAIDGWERMSHSEQLEALDRLRDENRFDMLCALLTLGRIEIRLRAITIIDEIGNPCALPALRAASRNAEWLEVGGEWHTTEEELHAVLGGCLARMEALSRSRGGK